MLIRLLTRLNDVLTDGLSISKFISRRDVDGFLTKFPHERDWSLYFRNVSWDAYFKMASGEESASLTNTVN